MTALRPLLRITLCCGASALPLLLNGCMLGPDYHRPSAIISERFKELSPAPGWSQANPAMADLSRGEWWRIYNDPVLNKLEEQVDISNQNLKEVEAAYRAARATIDAVRAGLFPTVQGSMGWTRRGQGNGNRSGFPGLKSSQTSDTYSLDTSASWELDLWGRIRRNVQSQVASTQASAADLANARLSYQSQLATAYFSLRYQDSLKQLLKDTIASYERSLRVVQNQYNAGVIEPTALFQAQTQLQQTKAQLINADVARSQYEHAIATLIGKPPAQLSIPPGALPKIVPPIPMGVPSLLLQRRPDIAAAERRMEAANARIGAAMAAFFPAVTLSGSLAYTGSPIGSLIEMEHRVWSIGASASEVLFQGGARTAAIRQAEAEYDQNVAAYRQTVLEALQNTENELSNLRILAQQAEQQKLAVHYAQQSQTTATNQYLAGTVDYTTVVNTEVAKLSNEQTALGIQQQRILASIRLIEQLGGGWDSARLPGKDSLQTDNPLLPTFMQRDKN